MRLPLGQAPLVPPLPNKQVLATTTPYAATPSVQLMAIPCVLTKLYSVQNRRTFCTRQSKSCTRNTTAQKNSLLRLRLMLYELVRAHDACRLCRLHQHSNKSQQTAHVADAA
jgi:hypothetical protein